MNNATGRLFLKASHKASAFSGILLEHVKQRSSATAYHWRPGGDVEGGLLVGFFCFRGRKCPLKQRWKCEGCYARKWELFWGKGGRWKRSRWALTLVRGRNLEESQERDWQLRHTNALCVCVFRFSRDVSLDVCCLEKRDGGSSDALMYSAERFGVET